jgi:hypothetical protein
MHEWRGLYHAQWECEYHIVIIPKYPKRMLYCRVKQYVGETVKEVCGPQEIELVESEPVLPPQGERGSKISAQQDEPGVGKLSVSDKHRAFPWRCAILSRIKIFDSA